MKNSHLNKSRVGFLPCFSRYDFSHFPYEKLYANPPAVEKVKYLVSALIDCHDPNQLHLKAGVGKGGICPVRPDSKEGKELIRLFAVPFPIYRIDYGDSKFKIIFGFSSPDGQRIAYILAFDMDHTTFG